MASARYGKVEAGVGAKPDDAFCVPLCGRDHQTGPEAQHKIGERAFWNKHGIDPFALALTLFVFSGDQSRCESIIQATKAERHTRAVIAA
jgi:hypothetical protein